MNSAAIAKARLLFILAEDRAGGFWMPVEYGDVKSVVTPGGRKRSVARVVRARWRWTQT